MWQQMYSEREVAAWGNDEIIKDLGGFQDNSEGEKNGNGETCIHKFTTCVQK
jgi:hypothetical protein